MSQRPPQPSLDRPRVLLTGVAGLIGSSLARELLAAGWTVLGIDDFSAGWEARLPQHEHFEFVRADVSEAGLLESLLSNAPRFDALVHLAARVGVRSVLLDPEGCRTSNLNGVCELIRGLQSLPAEHRPRIYAASTSEVYADAERPLREGDATRSLAGVGRWAYAASKLQGEQRLDAAWHNSPTTLGPVHLRFFNVVGPGQDADSGMVLANFVEQALRGSPLTVHGDGAQVRTLAHVDEIARTLCALITRGDCPAGPLNVGGNARTTILDLARCVIATSKSTSQIARTDPLTAIGANFEGIAFREPDLARLANCGVPLPTASLQAIVADTLNFHALRARPTAADPCVSPAF